MLKPLVLTLCTSLKVLSKSEDPQVVQVGQLRPPNCNIEDDEVVANIDHGHILRDLALVHEFSHKASCSWTQLEVRRLRVGGTQPKTMRQVVIEKDQDTVHLGLEQVYIHIRGSFKAPLQSETLLWES